MGPKVHALIPGLDLLNFSPESQNYFRVAAGSILYMAGSNFRAGDEVCDSYGVGKNDTYLLTHYGFLHDSEEASYVSLQPTILDDQNAELKRRILSTQPRARRELRVYMGDIKGVHLLRVGLMHPDELSAYNVKLVLSQESIPVARVQRTELATMQWLADSCRNKLFEVQRHDPLASPACEGDQWLLAREYRERVLWLWQQCVEMIDSRLRYLQKVLPPPASVQTAMPPPQPPLQPLQTAPVAPVARVEVRRAVKLELTPRHGQQHPMALRTGSRHHRAFWNADGAARVLAHCGAGAGDGILARIRLSSLETRRRGEVHTAPPWLNVLVEKALQQPHAPSSGRMLCLAASSAAQISRRLGGLPSFAWLSALPGPAAAAALRSLPDELLMLEQLSADNQ